MFASCRAALAVIAIVVLSSHTCAAEPGPISDELRKEWKLDPFYQKQLDVGILVVGSGKVADHALAEAGWIVGRMLDGRDDLLKAMRANRVRVVVMAATEYTTDVPEHSSLSPKLFWDRRARGLGATRANPVVSCGEENLLGHPGDPYPAENIFVHEFAHAIHGTGLSTTDPTFDRRLRAAHRAALDRGLWKNTYAATNHSEYWAEGVQCWFDDNAPADALHNDVRTRTKLKEYDVELAKLCQEVFGDKPWRYLRPQSRPVADRKHLTGFDPKKFPRFQWRNAPVKDKARLTIQTALGDFDVEIDGKRSPEIGKKFLQMALDGEYHSGSFDRSDSTSVQARTKKVPLAKEPVRKLVPVDVAPGTFAVQRETGEIVVFTAAVKEADASLAILGQVVKGMDTVQKLHAARPSRNDKEHPPIDVRRVIRTE